MATTGFWPVKSRLKDVIDYAENPDKTTDKKYLDEDLYNALRYVGDDNKTDKKMYVSAINCPTKRAYEHMMATKQRYGKLGGMSPITAIRVLLAARSHLKKHTKSVWKPQGVCGARIMR